MMKKQVVIGTRASKLALWQTHFVADALRAAVPGIFVSVRHIMTTGDKILDVPLAKIGGKGLFTKEIETALLNGEIDLAVHSLKDMPTELPPGLTLSAITARTDPQDAFVSNQYSSLDALPPGARVGTSSLRRTAQILCYRPDLDIKSLRGNVDTRLRKLDCGEYDAIILAAAGLKRLGLSDRIRQALPPEICLPAVGQGALAIETRAEDDTVIGLVRCLEDTATRYAVTAERAFLRVLEGGCQAPVGVYGQVQADSLRLDAVILSPDGKRRIQDTIDGSSVRAAELGQALARRMLEAGGEAILAALTCSNGGI